MPADSAEGAALLACAYRDLDLFGGDLVEASAVPPAGIDPDVWREVGDWLLLGARVGAERIFFVQNDPVLVFSALPKSANEKDIMALYRRAWSMARPRCLFLAVGQELRVYGLDAPPVPGDVAPSEQHIEPLEIVRRAADVSEALGQFHRNNLESGAAFEESNLSRSTGRADQRLLKDVQAASEALVESGLKASDAHALIERAILIRYLEDREVLIKGYFEDIVNGNGDWESALAGDDIARVNMGSASLFVNCLSDKTLTYELFSRLATDFNGDLFVPAPGEREIVTSDHLLLLQGLLLGTAASVEDQLFLWAYDFSVVPTSLVSTMYELFYNQEDDTNDDDNTHYTPPELVEFVLADLLSPSILKEHPGICDPACGSGIFLVEAFRRIVRFEAAAQGCALSTVDLRQILLDRIAGCDINESAIRLAAFSLYVAFLNYQTPHDIRQAGPLPRLIRRNGGHDTPAPLVVTDAFPAETGSDGGSSMPWSAHSFDVVVGNPPWSEPKQKAKTQGEIWAKRRQLPFGDRSPSQLFMWRALDLLTDNGVAALLVSAKVLLNVRTTSKAFRARWLQSARVEHVVNFSDVRRDFFEQAVAPFALVRFRRAPVDPNGPLVYETARRVSEGRRGSMALARLDRRIVDQAALIDCDYLWKTYSAGSHRDVALLRRLELENRLRDLRPKNPKSQYGYQRAKAGQANAHPPGQEWRDLPSLGKIDSWGPIQNKWLDSSIPEYVKFVPDPILFLDRSLLVWRFVGADGPAARLTSEPIAFRHTIYGIPFGHRPLWQAQVALGSILSSVGRYWLFLVSGAWGTWKDEVRVDDLLDVPVRIDRTHPATKRIVNAVKQLPKAAPFEGRLTESTNDPELDGLLTEIDDAMADLFELTTAERDLIDDFWASRTALTAPTSAPIPENLEGRTLSRYLETFKSAWKSHLPDDIALDEKIWKDPDAKVIAAVFEARDPGESPQENASYDTDAWSSVLERYNPDLLHETRAGSLVSYGMVRAVTDSAIVVLKRNEARLWSRTAAREDAEATVAQMMMLQGQ
jgi:N-6 DNA Methylase